MKTFTLFSFLIILFQTSASQSFFQTTVSSMFDDNVNNNAEQLKSTVTSFQLNGGYSWTGEESNVDLFYDGSYTYYASLLERTNHFHSVNLQYSSSFGEEGLHSFSIGTSAGSNINRDLYTVFDHSVYSLMTEVKVMTAEWMILKGGYSARSLAFTSLQDFSYSEHTLFLHTALALTPTTTMILQSDLGSKFYSTTPAGESSSMKKGVLSSLMPSVTQVTGIVRIGQRLSDGLGISVTERYQWNLQKQTRYLSSDYGYISDDELFDDHYGYEGLHSSVSVTSLVSETVTLKLSGGIQNKLYSTLPAYDLEGNVLEPQRKDTRSYLNLVASRNFTEYGFTLKAAVDFIENSSNDAWYRYRNNAVTLEVGIPF